MAKKPNKNNIRISNYNPVLANTGKQTRLTTPFDLYKFELHILINQLIYDFDQIPNFLPKEIVAALPFPARMSQVLAKQAVAIARSITVKVKLARNSENLKKYQREILTKYNSGLLQVDINSVNIELDSRFISIEKSKDTKICEYWIKISSFMRGNFYIPLVLTRHMKKLIDRGFVLKTNSLRVNNDGSLGFYFHKTVNLSNDITKIQAIDIGRKKLIARDDGHMETTHKRGLPIDQIMDIVASKKHGSKAQKRARNFLRNEINYSLKRDINFDAIDYLITENLTGMKTGKSWGYKNHTWCLSYINNRIEELAAEHDVHVFRINPAYTSQRCSECGHVHADSRRGEYFVCVHCGYVSDADTNAARNILTRGLGALTKKTHKGTNSSLGKKQRLNHNSNDILNT